MSKLIDLNVFTVAGTKYRCKQAEVDALPKGTHITFEREPTNEYDVNAIKCLAGDSQLFIGYVPAVVAKHLSPMIDNGEKFFAKVQQTLPKTTIKAVMFWEKGA